jgi:hypothetical protein
VLKICRLAQGDATLSYSEWLLSVVGQAFNCYIDTWNQAYLNDENPLRIAFEAM